METICDKWENNGGINRNCIHHLDSVIANDDDGNGIICLHSWCCPVIFGEFVNSCRGFSDTFMFCCTIQNPLNGSHVRAAVFVDYLTIRSNLIPLDTLVFTTHNPSNSKLLHSFDTICYSNGLETVFFFRWVVLITAYILLAAIQQLADKDASFIRTWFFSLFPLPDVFNTNICNSMNEKKNTTEST